MGIANTHCFPVELWLPTIHPSALFNVVDLWCLFKDEKQSNSALFWAIFFPSCGYSIHITRRLWHYTAGCIIANGHAFKKMLKHMSGLWGPAVSACFFCVPVLAAILQSEDTIKELELRHRCLIFFRAAKTTSTANPLAKAIPTHYKTRHEVISWL